MNEEWKTRLRTTRQALGLSKTDFAIEIRKIIKVSNPTVTDWEKSIADGGIKELSAPRLLAICDVLKVSPHWLIYGHEQETPQARNLAREVAMAFDSLNEDQQNAILATLKGFKKEIQRQPVRSDEVSLSTVQTGGLKQNYGSSSSQ